MFFQIQKYVTVAYINIILLDINIFQSSVSLICCATLLSLALFLCFLDSLFIFSFCHYLIFLSF